MPLVKGLEPQLMIFMMSAKDIDTYRRIKKSADCRYGVVSQCMQNAHVIKKSHQYISNVLMKVNAKLGGSTAKVAGVSITPARFGRRTENNRRKTLPQVTLRFQP
jgi:hypothetical protein